MTSAPVHMWALASEALVECPVPAGATSVHELYDALPLGVYTALRTFAHERFLALDLHFDRTDRCLELLGRPDRLDRARLRSALDRIARGAPTSDSVVRIDFLAEAVLFTGHSARVLVATSPFSPVSEKILTEGVHVGITRTLSRPRPRIKTAQFVIERRPYPLGRQDAFEHVMVDDRGRLLEGTSSNFHGIARGRLRTLEDGVLDGITRRILLRLAHTLEIDVDLAAIHESELGELDEAFLTSSTRGIVPIVDVGGHAIGDGRPGPMTRALRQAYDADAEREARPAV